MVADIGNVKSYIKPKADSTLLNMRKRELIAYIRCLEHNCNVAVAFNNQQAKNFVYLRTSKKSEMLALAKQLEFCGRNSDCMVCERWHIPTGEWGCVDDLLLCAAKLLSEVAANVTE